MLRLLGVVFGGGRRLVLEVDGICDAQRLAHAPMRERRAAVVPALIMCGRVILAHVRCSQRSSGIFSVP